MHERPDGSAVKRDGSGVAIQGYLDAVNATLARHETVKRFAILPMALSVENGLLTASLKVRRTERQLGAHRNRRGMDVAPDPPQFRQILQRPRLDPLLVVPLDGASLGAPRSRGRA